MIPSWIPGWIPGWVPFWAPGGPPGGYTLNFASTEPKAALCEARKEPLLGGGAVLRAQVWMGLVNRIIRKMIRPQMEGGRGRLGGGFLYGFKLET